MLNFKQLVLITLIAGSAGCSTTGNILPTKDSASGFEGAVYGGETVEYGKLTPGATEYRLFNQGATGFVSVEANRVEAESRATQFCKDAGKQYRLLQQTTSKPPHILGNYPRVEIIFECR